MQTVFMFVLSHLEKVCILLIFQSQHILKTKNCFRLTLSIKVLT